MCLRELRPLLDVFFFFNDTATTEIYTLSLHDALPIYPVLFDASYVLILNSYALKKCGIDRNTPRSEEHTSELQSRSDLVCRLLLEKKKKKPPPAEHNSHDLPNITSTVVIS